MQLSHQYITQHRASVFIYLERKVSFQNAISVCCCVGQLCRPLWCGSKYEDGGGLRILPLTLQENVYLICQLLHICMEGIIAAASTDYLGEHFQGASYVLLHHKLPLKTATATAGELYSLTTAVVMQLPYLAEVLAWCRRSVKKDNTSQSLGKYLPNLCQIFAKSSPRKYSQIFSKKSSLILRWLRARLRGE